MQHSHVGGNFGRADRDFGAWPLPTGHFQVQKSTRDSDVGRFEQMIVWRSSALVVDLIVAG